MKISDIKDVFFDLDHTLYDFEANAKITFSKAFSFFGLEDLDSFMNVFSVVNEYYWNKFEKGEITHEELRYGRLKDSFAKIHQNIEDIRIYQLSDYFVQNLPNQSQLLHGAKEILDYLYPKYNLHIITNGPAEVQLKKMDNAQLSNYFQTVTNSELAGVKKPHPDIFEYALQISGADRKKSIMIGDSLTADVFGAIHVGIDAIFFNENRRLHTHKIREIFSLIELRSIL